MQASPWVVRAGPTAYRLLRQGGWNWENFQVALAASGGPKWLILGAMDRVLAQLLNQRSSPLHLLGSSSGAYRFAAYIQPNPVQAIEALEHSYIEADWSALRPLTQLRQSATGILRSYIQPRPLEHPSFRLHVSTSLCSGWLASEHRLLQSLGLLGASILAARSRTHMGRLVRRVLFSDPRAPLPSRLLDIPSLRATLDASNLHEAILASGSIPLALPGEYDVGDAPRGCLRDGGLVDYHFDNLHLETDGLIFYPHFASELQPGWLERMGPRRALRPEIFERMVLISPSLEWVARLPGGKIPDRNDAVRFGQRKRRKMWHEAVKRGQDLAEAFDEARFLERIQLFAPS